MLTLLSASPRPAYMGSVNRLLYTLGELPRARELLECAVQSDLENPREENPDVVLRRSNFGLVLTELGELPRARELLELALQSGLENLGEHHHSTTATLCNLALVYLAMGEARAIDTLEQALRSGERSFGADHPGCAQIRAHLAQALSKSGELERARREASEALRAVMSQPEGSFHRTNVERLVASLA
jgi:eukaryotic-like serine/threonine-protein kinase